MAKYYKVNEEDSNLEVRKMKRMIDRKTSEGTMTLFESNSKLIEF